MSTRIGRAPHLAARRHVVRSQAEASHCVELSAAFSGGVISCSATRNRCPTAAGPASATATRPAAPIRAMRIGRIPCRRFAGDICGNANISRAVSSYRAHGALNLAPPHVRWAAVHNHIRSAMGCSRQICGCMRYRRPAEGSRRRVEVPIVEGLRALSRKVFETVDDGVRRGGSVKQRGNGVSVQRLGGTADRNVYTAIMGSHPFDA